MTWVIYASFGWKGTYDSMKTIRSRSGRIVTYVFYSSLWESVSVAFKGVCLLSVLLDWKSFVN